MFLHNVLAESTSREDMKLTLRTPRAVRMSIISLSCEKSCIDISVFVG
jgi:hypothetical protein